MARSPASAAAPAAKNRPTAAPGVAPRPRAAVAAAAAIPTTAVVAASRWERRLAVGPRPRRSASGGRRPALRAAQPRATSAIAKVARPPLTSGTRGGGVASKARVAPGSTPAVHARPSRASRAAAQAGPRSVPTVAPIAAAIPPTVSKIAVTRRGGNPTAARMPRSRPRAATSRPNSSHASIRPAITTKLESARNRPPKGVEPREAARASSRRATTRRPASAGGIAAASVDAIAATAAGSAGFGRSQAVVSPNRPAARRRAVASDTNALGVGPWAFQ